MIVLMVLLAQVEDLVTFLMAQQHFGMWGESMPGAQLAYSAAGPLGVVLLKAGGAILATAVAAALVARFPRRRRWLLFASAAGILGAASNLTALLLVG